MPQEKIVATMAIAGLWCILTACNPSPNTPSSPRTSVSSPEMPLIERQLFNDPNYQRTVQPEYTTYESGEITFFVGKDGKIQLYISFLTHPTLDCSVYLPMRHYIQETVEIVRNKTPEEHLRAACRHIK